MPRSYRNPWESSNLRWAQLGIPNTLQALYSSSLCVHGLFLENPRVGAKMLMRSQARHNTARNSHSVWLQTPKGTLSRRRTVEAGVAAYTEAATPPFSTQFQILFPLQEQRYQSTSLMSGVWSSAICTYITLSEHLNMYQDV